MTHSSATSSNTGLSEADLATIRGVLSQFSDIHTTLIYGSRAIGTYHLGSDIDLALIGNLYPDTISLVSDTLNEVTNLPYFFDVTDYQKIDHAPFKAHIDQHGLRV